MKKRNTVIAAACVIIVLLGIAINARILYVRQYNAELVIKVRSALAGEKFVGEKRETNTVDKGGAIKLIEFTDTKIECEFKKDGKVIVTTIESYSDGLGVVTNGEYLYDDVKTEIKEYELEEVKVEWSGNIKAKIGWFTSSVGLDQNDNPIYIVVDGIKCDIV